MEVQRAQAKQLQQADLTAARTLEEIRRIAFFYFGALFDAKGHLKPIRDLAPEARAVLASVKVVRQNITVGDGKQEWVHKVKVWDKVRALEMLAKHFKLLVEQVDVNIIDWDKLAAPDTRRLLPPSRHIGDSCRTPRSDGSPEFAQKPHKRHCSRGADARRPRTEAIVSCCCVGSLNLAGRQGFEPR